MASLTVTLTAICSGGEHLTFVTSGAKVVTAKGSLSEIQLAVTDDEAVAFLKVLAKLVKVGKTLAQARTALQSDVTITV